MMPLPPRVCVAVIVESRALADPVLARDQEHGVIEFTIAIATT